MSKLTIDNYSNYTPQFSTLSANELIEKCLQAVETPKPNINSLLCSINDLAKLVQTANYDHQLLKNLISENQLLTIERDTLKLAQISNFVMNMDIKLEKAERDCRDLQSELDKTELDNAEIDKPEFLSFQKISVQPTLRKATG